MLREKNDNLGAIFNDLDQTITFSKYLKYFQGKKYRYTVVKKSY